MGDIVLYKCWGGSHGDLLESCIHLGRLSHRGTLRKLAVDQQQHHDLSTATAISRLDFCNVHFRSCKYPNQRPHENTNAESQKQS